MECVELTYRKPRKIPIGHTSNPQFEKLANDPTMEALRDRTVKIDIPRLKKWSYQDVKVLHVPKVNRVYPEL